MYQATEPRLSQSKIGTIAERYSGARQRLRETAQIRLEHELKLIDRHGLAGFFLIYHRIFELVREDPQIDG